jgi:hypothetical protein
MGVLFLHCFFDHLFPIALNLPDLGCRPPFLRALDFTFFDLFGMGALPRFALRIAERKRVLVIGQV